MINSTTYRIISALLSISILLGVTLPRDLHAGSDELCDSMMSMHGDHMSSMMAHDDCLDAEKKQTSHPLHASESESEKHHSEINCACSFEDPTVKTESRVFQKTKILVLTSIDVLIVNDTNTNESTENAFQRLDSYSPPPIFLVNESFLI